MKELIDHLQEQIQNIPPDEMDDSSWGYEEGVLITGNQAKQIVGILERLDQMGAPTEYELDHAAAMEYKNNTHKINPASAFKDGALWAVEFIEKTIK